MKARNRVKTRWAALLAAFVFLTWLSVECGDGGAVAIRKVGTDRNGGTSAAHPTEIAKPGSPDSSHDGDSDDDGDSAEKGTLTFQVWFNRGGALFPVTRSHGVTQSVGRLALDDLFDGPTASEAASGIGTQVPAGTRLLDLDLQDGLATVDLSGTYESGGGSASMTMRLAQVVYTITQFPTVTGVNFRLDGHSVDVFSGEGIVLDHSVTRADYESLLPAIVVDTPRAGQLVSSPIEISGTANVFEATVSIRLRDANGKVIAEDFTTATCGSGCRGDYAAVLRYSVPSERNGVLEVYESSAKDGQPIHLVSIPLRLSR